MPAFGGTHSDAELKAAVAFIQRLPTMTPAQYAEFEKL
jgi:mono/diheme cytochrome c family protein